MNLVRRALIAQDLRIFSARDGIEALAVAKASGSHPDVLITDIRLAGIDGLTLATRLSTANPDLRIVVLSSECDDVVFLDPDIAARAAFIKPPVKRTALLELVRRMVGVRSAAARSRGA